MRLGSCLMFSARIAVIPEDAIELGMHSSDWKEYQDVFFGDDNAHIDGWYSFAGSKRAEMPMSEGFICMFLGQQ